jgi:hypothetical protein
LPARPAYVIPYNQYSKSAKALAKELGLFRTTTNLGGVDARDIDVINWGLGKLAIPFLDRPGSRVLNKVDGVNLTRNKLKFFKKAKEATDGPRIPEFFEALEDAMAAINTGATVFGRRTTGSCGTDIVQFTEDANRFNSSDFWVVYKKKKAEFRVHIFKRDGEYAVIDRQKKALRETDPVTGQPIDRSTVNFMIRNHRNGFIFQRNDIDVPKDVEVQALKAMKITGLDFGAVDVIWNEHEAKAYVLEINTAPGLEGTTLENYANEFRRLGYGSGEIKKVQEAAVTELTAAATTLGITDLTEFL